MALLLCALARAGFFLLGWAVLFVFVRVCERAFVRLRGVFGPGGVPAVRPRLFFFVFLFLFSGFVWGRAG
jgi:hypothetical protein